MAIPRRQLAWREPCAGLPAKPAFLFAGQAPRTGGDMVFCCGPALPYYCLALLAQSPQFNGSCLAPPEENRRTLHSRQV